VLVEEVHSGDWGITGQPRPGPTEARENAMRSRILRSLVIAVALVALAAPVGVAVATPSQGVSPKMLGKGTFDQRLKVNTSNIKARFKQPSDFVVLSLRFAPGGTTGWHSHPGPAMAIVQEGTFTLYNADDRKCRPHRYGPGQAFVDRGGGNVHIGRNETRKPVRVLVTFVVPEGAPTTIDAPDPGNCQF
jgi:quercetin dioxygenase-like cupin family protein